MTDHDLLLSGLADCRWNYLRGLADAAETSMISCEITERLRP